MIRQRIAALFNHLTGYLYDEIRELELAAVVLLEDGLNFRSIHHNLSLRSLTYYRFYKKRYVQYFINLSILVLLLMVFIEMPTSWTLSSDPTVENHNKYKFEMKRESAELLEMMLLIFLTLDMVIEYYIQRAGSQRRKYWLMFHLLFATLSFAELIANELTPNYNLMYRKMLRPFFLVRRSTLIKKMIKCLVNSVQQLVTVLRE